MRTIHFSPILYSLPLITEREHFIAYLLNTFPASKKGTQILNMPADNHHFVFSCQMRQTENFNFLHHRKICNRARAPKT